MGLDTHPAGPLAKATAAPNGAAMADGQRADRRITGGTDGAKLGLRALAWLPADIWGVTASRRYSCGQPAPAETLPGYRPHQYFDASLSPLSLSIMSRVNH
jgi:hypothetical protein